jgi:hypothetical protein
MVTPRTFDALVAEDRPRTSGLGPLDLRMATASHALKNTREMAKMNTTLVSVPTICVAN